MFDSVHSSNNNDENENRETIEKVLQENGRNYNLTVESIECSPGSQIGDNYMSVVKRVKVYGKLGTAAFTRTLIVKRQIASISRRELFRCDEAFENEIAAYCHLVPVFRQHYPQHVPFPICLFAGRDSDGEVVILEDLCESGYKMVNRLKGLDYSHCKIVVQELAKLHSISLIMKKQRPMQFRESLEKVKEIVYCPEAHEFYKHSLESSLREALSSLRSNNVQGDLNEPIDKMINLSGKIFPIMCDRILQNTDDWSVVCSGDLWVNNLMFRYDVCDQVEGVKFIDLQTVRYTSPVIDILHFIYSSTDKQLRSNKLDQLLWDYASTLLQCISKSDLPRGEVRNYLALFSFANIKRQYLDKMMYGLGIAMWLLPAVTFHPGHVPNLDVLTLNDFKDAKVEKAITQMQTPEYHVRMKDIVLEFYQKGYLN
ncbi:hypothetical protein Bhyg_13923 [Pseudolycoriella hygida]|uniref:CHK kinase-like domain-containing protein n=1 Tax=Pseudolycoriella hygida TaxID=35572 RepID=A0A9Q0RWY3_9DIPT|nr:hypothetical protein Bhyg_13923 [Pseudolycoriella hygida]